MAKSKLSKKAKRALVIFGFILAFIGVVILILWLARGSSSSSSNRNGPGHYHNRTDPNGPSPSTGPIGPNPGPGPGAGSSIAQQFVSEHNKYRALGGAGPVEWDDELASYAQQWSDWMAKTGTFNHTCIVKGKHCDLGQNLHMNYPPNNTPADAVGNWYAECPCYQGGFTHESGHYSQLMWKPVKKIGCAVAQAGDNQYWTCYYDTPQIRGEFAENVEKACGNCKKAAGCCAAGRPTIACCEGYDETYGGPVTLSLPEWQQYVASGANTLYGAGGVIPGGTMNTGFGGGGAVYRGYVRQGWGTG